MIVSNLNYALCKQKAVYILCRLMHVMHESDGAEISTFTLEGSPITSRITESLQKSLQFCLIRKSESQNAFWLESQNAFSARILSFSVKKDHTFSSIFLLVVCSRNMFNPFSASFMLLLSHIIPLTCHLSKCGIEWVNMEVASEAINAMCYFTFSQNVQNLNNLL